MAASRHSGAWEQPFRLLAVLCRTAVLQAVALARLWSVIQIGGVTPPDLAHWSIRSREFRENLEWAVIVPGDDADLFGGEGIARRS